MPTVLAVRTAEGDYFEFHTLRTVTEDGREVTVDLEAAPFAQVLQVGSRNGTPHTISGAGGIESDEQVKGI